MDVDRFIGETEVNWCDNFTYPADLEHRVMELLKKKKILLYRLTVDTIETDSLIFHSNGVVIQALDLDGGLIFLFRLIPMPGCCGILVSTGTNVGYAYRGKGLSYLMQDLKMELAQLNGYGMLYATTQERNAPENHVLAKCGWEITTRFTNPRTDNNLIQWNKVVPNKEV